MLEQFDCVSAKTTGASAKGTFVETENGVKGWISHRVLPKGLEVICTVHRVKEDGFPILLLDSVVYPAA